MQPPVGVGCVHSIEFGPLGGCTETCDPAAVAGLRPNNMISLLLLLPQLATDTLVVDISKTPSGQPNNGLPQLVGGDGTSALFTARSELDDSNSYLWSSDGTATGTTRVTDFPLTSLGSGASLPGGRIVFRGIAAGASGMWVSDGTSGGTQLLTPASGTGTIAHDGSAWFRAPLQPNGGTVLWTSDGTPPGTQPAFELTPAADVEVLDLMVGGGRLFFSSAIVGSRGLWTTDGTAAATSFVQPLDFSIGDGGFEKFASAGDRLVFGIETVGPDRGIWGSDGTVAGTERLLPGANASWIVAAGDFAYVASAGKLWRTDGTLAGTQPVLVATTFGSTQQSVSTEPGIAYGDRLAFSGSDPLGPCLTFEPMLTDGTLAGTVQIQDLFPGCPGSEPANFGRLGDLLVFTAEHPDFGRELWASDGTAAGTYLLADSVPGSGSPSFSPAIEAFPIQATVGGALYGNDDNLSGRELWRCTPTAAELFVNFQLDPGSQGSFPTLLSRFGDRLLFYATEAATGAEPYVSDGSAPGTTRLADVQPGPGSSLAESVGFVPLGDRALFLPSTSSGRQLWRTDGTPAGTELLLDGGLGTPDSLDATGLVGFADRLWFRRGSAEGSLWITDGTPSGTLQWFAPPAGSVLQSTLDATTNHLYFLLVDSVANTRDLWRTDGTSGGTERVLGAAGEVVFQFWCTSERVWWFGSDGTALGAWSSDESFLSPELLGGPDADTLFWELETELGERTVFSKTLAGPTVFGEVTEDGQVLVVSDGTSAGTVDFYDSNPGPGGFSLGPSVAAADRLVLLDYGWPGMAGVELVVTDGTPAGTQALLSLPDGSTSIPNALTPIGSGSTVLFRYADLQGEEAWRTDGTVAGTLPLTDTAPGPKDSSFQNPLQIAEQIYFAADDSVNGVELHSIPAALADSPAVTEIGVGCAGPSGTPRLEVDAGLPQLGTQIDLALTGSAPGAPSLWFSGGELGPLAPPGACFLGLFPASYLFTVVSDGSGRAGVSAGIGSDPALIGLALRLQALSIEPGGPLFGLGSSSNVLELVFGS